MLEASYYNGSLTQRNSYDEKQRLNQKDFTHADSNWEGTIKFEYDEQDRIVRKEDWSRVTVYLYK